MKLDDIKNILSRSGKMQFPENRSAVRALGADSMVLLKNNGILPMNKGKIALFGAGAVDTIYTGLFFNYVYTDGNVSVKDGLLGNGFTFSTDTWLEKMEKAVKPEDKKVRALSKKNSFAGKKYETPEVPITKADIAEAVLGTDTCIYVIRHNLVGAGPLLDREYRISDIEQANLKLVLEAFENVILVLNTNMLEMGQLARAKNVKAIVLMGIPGMEAGNSLADVLTGAVNPCGRLTATWAKKYKDYSTCYSSAVTNKNSKNNEIDYKEGVYVGYRYFDTFDVAPLYPFGYGLSYTTFDIKLEYFEASWISIMLRVKVTNTGSHAGRQVVQVYCSQPKGNIDKPYQILAGFAKTGKLKPGESEEITLKIPIMALCSFDEESTGWVMEAGDYLFRLGVNSRDTELCAKVVLDKFTTIKNVSKVIELKKPLEFIQAPERKQENTGFIMSASLKGDDYNSENKFVPQLTEFTTYVQEGSKYVSYINENSYAMPFAAHESIKYVKPCGVATFFDVVKGKFTIEEFVSSLSPEIMARIVVGATGETKIDSESRLKVDVNVDKYKYKISSRTTSQFTSTLGIPAVNIADGPSGLRIDEVPCTNFPSPMNMAQTWDMGAMVRMGRAMGREMEYYDIDFCLAPALNIHRNPMRSRAYEFYSEDPTLAGTMGGGLVMGIKRYEGRNVILKNLATYNQETGTADVNINVSRRAFGEIYLRAFSVCNFTSSPAGILNSGNRINGVYSSSDRGLNTQILRKDWGFTGFVLSDWGSLSEKPYDIHAGCDLIMPGFDPDELLQAMMETTPEFAEDGFVKKVEKAYKYGDPMIQYYKWGSFLPDKDGTDYVRTTVAADVPLNENVLRYQELGLCKVEDFTDGGKAVVYKGINRGAYLALGDLQQAVINVLSNIKNSASMKKLMDSAEI